MIRIPSFYDKFYYEIHDVLRSYSPSGWRLGHLLGHQSSLFLIIFSRAPASTQVLLAFYDYRWRGSTRGVHFLEPFTNASECVLSQRNTRSQVIYPLFSVRIRNICPDINVPDALNGPVFYRKPETRDMELEER